MSRFVQIQVHPVFVAIVVHTLVSRLNFSDTCFFEAPPPGHVRITRDRIIQVIFVVSGDELYSLALLPHAQHQS